MLKLHDEGKRVIGCMHPHGVFPFKASPYLVDELIDWDMAGAYLGVLKCCGAFTPSTRLVAISR